MWFKPPAPTRLWTRGTCATSTVHNTTRSEEHTSELQSRLHLVCRLLLEKKKKLTIRRRHGVRKVKTPNIKYYCKAILRVIPFRCTPHRDDRYSCSRQ